MPLQRSAPEHSRRGHTSLYAIGLALALVGCGESEPVPFGLEHHERPAPTDEPTTAAAPSASLREYPDGTRAEIDGVVIDVGTRTVRASYARDLDEDGDDDALLLLASPTGEADLALGLRDAETFALRDLGHVPVPSPTCLLTALRFESLAPSLALATVRWSCPNANGSDAAEHHLVVQPSALPRVVEEFAWRGAEGDGLTFVSADRDEDGHDDLIAEITVGQAHATLTFRSTAATMARDPGAPENAIVALADEARAAIRRHPETAETKANSALGLYDAVCAEGGGPRLQIGSAHGIPCGASVGALRARAVLVASYARRGQVLEALGLAETLRGVRLREAERRLADDALTALAITPEAHESVEAHPLDDTSVRRSTLAFADEDHVLVLGSAPQNVGLEDGVVTPTFDLDARIVDPSGHLQVRAIERRCDGTVVVVAPLNSMAAGLEDHTALFWPRPAPAGVPCPDMTAALRADSDGFVPLGWAPQGVLVVRLGELMLLPLDLSGNLTSPPSLLAIDVPAPAPVLPGAATSDMSSYALLTDHGILLVHRGATSAVRLVRPSGFVRQGTGVDVAVSPSGHRLAWIQDDHLRWCDVPSIP